MMVNRGFAIDFLNGQPLGIRLSELYALALWHTCAPWGIRNLCPTGSYDKCQICYQCDSGKSLR